MLNGLKKIIPRIGDIRLSFIADGTYSSVFKSEILDTDGMKIISDKAIKCYHANPDPWIEIDKKCADYLSQHSSANIIKHSNYKITLLDFERTKQNILNYVNNMKKYGTSTHNFSSKMHGAYAEANITEYIRHFSGHKLTYKNGIILPDMFVLSDKPFSISEFVDESMKADKIFDFSRLGLLHTDLSANKNNLINGICVDLGGIMPIINYELLKKLVNPNISQENKYKCIEKARSSVITGDKDAISFLKKYKDRNIKFDINLENLKYNGIFSNRKTAIINEIAEKRI